jgi:hypothetical protein
MRHAGITIDLKVNEERTNGDRFIQRRNTISSSIEKALSEAGFSLRRGVCDLGAYVRKTHGHGSQLYLSPAGFMNRENQDSQALQSAKCDLASEVLDSFGRLRFAATGWSMLPSIWPGETLVVERISSEHVRIGDVVLTGRDSGLRAHRVASIVGNGETRQWITQGDALSTPDPPVNEDELLGRVVYLIRGRKCIPVSAELTVIESLLAKIVRRSVPAARALVYLNRRHQG